VRGLKGKVVIVTGGARGIGAEIVRRFGDEGAKVVIFDLLGEQASALADKLSGHGAVVRSRPVDISDVGAVVGAVAEVERSLGPIDVLVNNAGLNRPGAFVDTKPADWRLMIDVNYIGPLNMHHAVAPDMAKRGSGRIVNVASDAGRIGAPGEAVYSGCKGAVIAFSKTLAKELGGRGVTVNVVCPGPTETQLLRDVVGDGERANLFRERVVRATPLGRIGQPRDPAGAVCFLASDDAAFITGQVLSVSGGLTTVG
jgi:2-hydroxycyclohexanecarboxyl-CoA dehydrogenase